MRYTHQCIKCHLQRKQAQGTSKALQIDERNTHTYVNCNGSKAQALRGEMYGTHAYVNCNNGNKYQGAS